MQSPEDNKGKMESKEQQVPASAPEEVDDVIADLKIEKEKKSPTTKQLVLSLTQATIVQSFPWMAEFFKMCQSEIALTNIRTLERFMKFYQKNVIQSVKECYSRPNRAAKLKKYMSDTIMFFHMNYSDFKPPIEHSSYLAKMSEIMAMYLDMEIKASRTGTESLPKIASKLTSSLHVYFGKSYDHILDTILKSKIISKNYWELSDLIFRRVLRDSPGSSVYVISYIRFLLAFKMWKGIMKSPDDRKKIAKLAAMKLHPPSGFREKLSSGGVLRDILPRVPKSRPDITAFLMQAKFSVRDKIKLFLKAVSDPKLQCVLDRQNFSNDELFPSAIDDQEETESNTLMNDIWSSMDLEQGIRESNRIASVAEGKRAIKFKTTGLRSCKIEAAKKKKKKIIEIVVDEIGEDDVIELTKAVLGDKTEDLSVSTIKSELEETPQKEEIILVDSASEGGDPVELPLSEPQVELPRSPIPVVIEEQTPIKIESVPSRSKNPVYPPSVWNLSNFQPYYSNAGFDYISNAKTSNFLDPQMPVGQDRSDLYAMLAKEALTNEEVRSCSEDVEEDTVRQALPEPDVEVELPVPDFKSLEDLRAHTVGYEKAPIPDYKTIEDLRTQGVGYEKSGTIKEIAANDYPFEENRIGMLHDFTIKSDSKMYQFQMKIYSYSNKLTARAWINILSPLFSEQCRLKMYRCWCSGCKNNLCVIRRNWKSVISCIMLNSERVEECSKGAAEEDSALEELKAAVSGEKGDVICWESEIEEFLKKIEDAIKCEENEHSSLPLKKRKAFSYSNYGKDVKTTELSYPCTPMISIAELELAREKCRYNAMNLQTINNPAPPPPPPNYMPGYSVHAINYSIMTDPKFNSVIVQPPKTAMISEQQNLVPGAFTASFVPELQQQEPRIKFKTPAQLKGEFQVQHLDAAQELINFAHSSRSFDKTLAPPYMVAQKTAANDNHVAYMVSQKNTGNENHIPYMVPQKTVCNENHLPFIVPQKRQTKQKSKSSSRKRKRN